MALYILVGFFWLLPMTGLGLGGIFGGEMGNGLCLLLVAWGPVLLIAWGERRRLAKRDAGWARAHAEMLAAGGVLPGVGLDHSEEDTGIAVNPQQRLILLMAGGVYKSYDYEGIRAWEAREEQAGNAVGVGVAGALAAGTANAGNAMRAAKNTGLFVRVRNREVSEWRISMRDKATRARWMEILRQEINESPASARS